MDRRFYIALFGVFLSPLFSPDAIAQESENPEQAPYQAYIAPVPGTEQNTLPRKTGLADITYEHLVDRLLFDRPERFNFMELRAQYYQSRFYDPLAQKPVEEMQRLAYLVQTDKNPNKVVGALADYNSILRTHIANIAVVSQALSLSRQDARFGDTKQLERIKKGLFDSVLVSGDGMSLQGAYDVITMDEEIMLMRHLNYDVQKVEPVESGIIFYNMHFVIERGTDHTFVIFVNTTIPMTYLERQKSAQGQAVNLRKR